MLRCPYCNKFLHDSLLPIAFKGKHLNISHQCAHCKQQVLLVRPIWANFQYSTHIGLGVGLVVSNIVLFKTQGPIQLKLLKIGLVSIGFMVLYTLLIIKFTKTEKQ